MHPSVGAAAAAECRKRWEEAGGPNLRPENDEDLREFTGCLTLWEQIELFVGEVDLRPHNSRSWKLLGYAYMRAGVYIPALLRAAEQAFLVSAAHEEDAALLANVAEKVELCRQAAAGERAARAELVAGEEAFARRFESFPPSVPMPAAFMVMGIIDRPALVVTAAVVAPDFLRLVDG